MSVALEKYVHVRNHPRVMYMATCIRELYRFSVCFGHGIARTRACTLRIPYGTQAGTIRTRADTLRVRDDAVRASEQP